MAEDNISFTEERKGYAKDEVDKYIDMMQVAIQKLDDKNQKMQEQIKHHETEKTTQFQQASNIAKMLEDEKKKNAMLQQELDEQASKVPSGEAAEALTNENKKLQDEVSEKDEEIKKLEEKLAATLMKPSTDQEQRYQTQAAQLSVKLEGALREIDNMKREKLILNERISKLDADNKNKQEKIGKLIDAQKNSMPESQAQQLSHIFVQAQQTIETYNKEAAEDRKKQIEETQRKCDQMVAEAKEKADTIIEEAKGTKFDEIEKIKDNLAKKKKDTLAECEALQAEAQMVLNNAKEEAESIRAQSDMKVEQAHKLRDLIIAKANERAENIQKSATEGYETSRQQLEELASKYQELFKTIKIGDVTQEQQTEEKESEN